MVLTRLARRSVGGLATRTAMGVAGKRDCQWVEQIIRQYLPRANGWVGGNAVVGVEAGGGGEGEQGQGKDQDDQGKGAVKGCDYFLERHDVPPGGEGSSNATGRNQGADSLARHSRERVDVKVCSIPGCAGGEHAFVNLRGWYRGGVVSTATRSHV